MENFTGYEKMPESFKNLKLDTASSRLLDKVQWAVTEKVHGANFCFIYERDELGYGKRKELLSWEDDFFGFQLVVEKYSKKIISIFQSIKEKHPYKRCVLYGELFGGEYPHPEVEKDPRLQAIQTGVYYSPDIEFYAFDIAVEPEDEKKERYYMDFEESIILFEKESVFYAKPLYIGKLNEALNFIIGIQSTIPSRLGLPLLTENLAEGVVVKPMKNIVLSTSKGIVRPLLKIKNEKFSEEEKYHEAQKWSYIPGKPIHKEELEFLLPELKRFLTLNRLENTISKTGKANAKDLKRMNEIRSLLLTDVFEAFENSFPGLLSELSEKEQEWLREEIKTEMEVLLESLLSKK